jgi:hypothetical protein
MHTNNAGLDQSTHQHAHPPRRAGRLQSHTEPSWHRPPHSCPPIVPSRYTSARAYTALHSSLISAAASSPELHPEGTLPATHEPSACSTTPGPHQDHITTHPHSSTWARGGSYPPLRLMPLSPISVMSPAGSMARSGPSAHAEMVSGAMPHPPHPPHPPRRHTHTPRNHSMRPQHGESQHQPYCCRSPPRSDGQTGCSLAPRRS